MNDVVFFIDNDENMGRAFHCTSHEDVENAVIAILDDLDIKSLPISHVLSVLEDTLRYDCGLYGRMYYGGMENPS